MSDNVGIIFDKHIQVKMLILFVMSRLTLPITLEMLTELALCDDRLSYFDVTDCIPKLVNSKHLYESDGKYSLTAKGHHNSEILEEDLLYSVRVKAEEAAARINDMLARDSLIKTASKESQDGSRRVQMSLSDGVGNILSVDIIAANKKQADDLENGFRKNAQTLYHDIINVITK